MAIKSIWVDRGSYEEIAARDGLILLEPRPDYCDRGNWVAKPFLNIPINENPLDWQDGWPRYYMNKERAKLEIEEWLKKRKQFME